MCPAFLISASYDKQIRFWDAACGRTVRCFTFQDSQVNALLLIPDTTHLAVAGFGVVRVYDIATTGAGATAGGVGGQALPLFSSYENSSAMNMTSLGSFPMRLQKNVDSSFNNSAEASNISLFNNTCDFGLTSQPIVGGNAPSGLATALYATSEDGHIRFFNASTPTMLQLIWDISTGAAITCSALSPNRETLLTGSQIGRVSIWDLPTIIAVATKQTESAVHVVSGQKPIQEISFDADYTAIRSIAVEPLARWAVAATNAGKVHFLRFVNQSDSTKLPTSKKKIDDKTAANDSSSEVAAEDLAVNQKPSTAEDAEVLSGGFINYAQDANYMRVESVYRSALVSNELGNSGLKCGVLASSSVCGGNKKSLDSEATSSKGLDSNAIPVSDICTTQAQEIKSTSENLFMQKLLCLRPCRMEVFYSFQAHYKYILKVAISPNSDLLVTCCADYTVGRFLIPPELQQLDTADAENSEDKTHIVSGNCTFSEMPAVADFGGGGGGDDDVVNSETKNANNAGGVENSLALQSPQQPATLEDTLVSDGGIIVNNEAGTTEPVEGEDIHKASEYLSESKLPQGVSKLMGNVGIDSADTQDISSMRFSVVQSYGLEGNTECQPAKKAQFTALKPLTGHTRWVWDGVFSDCGQFLFTASSDHNLRMWTGLLTDRVQSTCFNGHTKPVLCCILYYEKKRQNET